MGKRGSVELQHFFSDVQDLLAKVTDLDDRHVAALRSRVQDSLDSARESVRDRARRIRETAADWHHQARDTVVGHARSARREIRARPLTIGLAAAVIGVALGALLARSRADE